MIQEKEILTKVINRFCDICFKEIKPYQECKVLEFKKFTIEKCIECFQNDNLIYWKFCKHENLITKIERYNRLSFICRDKFCLKKIIVESDTLRKINGDILLKSIQKNLN